MQILVTGCSGLVGLHLIESLTKKGHAVIGFDRTEPIIKLPNFIFEQGDLADYDRFISVLTQYRADCIVHCGGISHPKIGTADQIIQANINGTHNVFEGARNFRIKRVINLSSGAVYGNNQLEYTTEESPLNPTSIYGVSKVAGEQIAKIYNETHGIDIISLRVCFVYGPRRMMHEPIKSFLERLIKGENIKDNLGGEQRFEFIYVKDVVSCIEKLIHVDEIKGRVYNIGSGKLVSLREVADIVGKLFPNQTIEIGPGTLGYDMIGAFDCQKVKEDLAFEPVYSLEDGMKEYADFLKIELTNANI